MDKKKIIPIVLSSDNNYVPYLYVCLTSLVKYTTEEYFYSIFILHTEIEEYTKQIFMNGLNKENIRIKFIDVTERVASYNLKIEKYWSFASYYRLLIPELFWNYEKVIYLDADILLCHNIAELLESALQEKGVCLAAAEDMYLATCKDNPEMMQYLKEKLELDIEKIPFYFNSGVLVYHIPNIRRIVSVKGLLKMAESSYQYIDQDILNKVFAGKVQWIDRRWNYFPVWNIKGFRPDIQKEILTIRKELPYIIHYAGGKPWNSSDRTLFTELWWSVARETPYYEQLLRDFMSPIFQKRIEEKFEGTVKRYKLERLRKICRKFPLGGGIRKRAIVVYEWMRKKLEAKEKHV